MQTKGSITNLINRYRAVLRRCRLIDVFGSLAVATALVMGGAAGVSASYFGDKDKLGTKADPAGEWTNVAANAATSKFYGKWTATDGSGGDGTVDKLYGGYTTGSEEVTDNQVTVKGGTVTRAVYGGYSNSSATGSDAKEVTGNKVAVSGGTFTEGSGTTIGIMGGYAQNASGAVKVGGTGEGQGNVVTISGTATGTVSGGHSLGSGDVAGNKVGLSGGRVDGDGMDVLTGRGDVCIHRSSSTAILSVLQRRSHHEMDVSTQQGPSRSHARFPSPHELGQRPRRPGASPCQGAQGISALIRDRRNRLLRRSEFMSCYETGRRFHTRRFLIFARRNDLPDAVWRVGFAVSGKIGVAVERNRVKRVLREFFRLNQMDCPSGTDIAVVAKKGLDVGGIALGNVTAELMPALGEIRRRLGIRGIGEAHEDGRAPNDRP